jgi:cyclin B
VQSISKYFEASNKKTNEFHDDIYFENTLEKFRSFDLGDILKRHEITEKFRGKIMDWMIEVMKIYKQKDETVFKSLFIMDSYIAKRKTSIKSTELHLISACCMMIASKQEEVKPIRLKTVFEDVCKQKYTKAELVASEVDILMTVGFRTNVPTMFDVVRCVIRIMSIENRETALFIENISLLMCKMISFSTQMIKKFTPIEIVSSALILSLKLIENLKSDFVSDFHVC